MITIAEQIDAMRKAWPQFRVTASDQRSAVWMGDLSPFSRTYVVRIIYRTPVMGEAFTIGRIQPRVTILNPLLERHPEFEDGPIPHVYWVKDDANHPVLCLFSPEGREWETNDLIAKTTVYWAARWLGFYEGWLAIGKWKGGGHHIQRKQGKRLETV